MRKKNALLYARNVTTNAPRKIKIHHVCAKKNALLYARNCDHKDLYTCIHLNVELKGSIANNFK